MNKLVATIISLYVAMSLYVALPIVQQFEYTKDGPIGVFLSDLAVFLVLFILLEIILSKHIATTSMPGFMGSLQALALVIAIIGLMLSVLYHIIPVVNVYTLPKVLDRLFTSDLAFDIWLGAPLVLLFF
jgi:hypothetical protein